MRLIVPAHCLMAVIFLSIGNAAETPAPKTLQEQISYLEGALAESLRARDLGMLDMAVKGFKAAGLAGKELEISVLRAERDAAWSNAGAGGYGQLTPAASLEIWGLMARAKLGSEQATTALRDLTAELPAAPPPLPAW